eukprot:8333419-Pyramimonas_sp.AAC.1
MSVSCSSAAIGKAKRDLGDHRSTPAAVPSPERTQAREIPFISRGCTSTRESWASARSSSNPALRHRWT